MKKKLQFYLKLYPLQVSSRGNNRFRKRQLIHPGPLKKKPEEAVPLKVRLPGLPHVSVWIVFFKHFNNVKGASVTRTLLESEWDHSWHRWKIFVAVTVASHPYVKLIMAIVIPKQVATLNEVWASEFKQDHFTSHVGH